MMITNYQIIKWLKYMILTTTLTILKKKNKKMFLTIIKNIFKINLITGIINKHNIK